MRPPSARSRIDATDDVSARYGFRSRLCCSNDDMPDRDRVPRGKAVAPIVVRQAKLAEAGDGLDRGTRGARSWLCRQPEPQIAAADRDGLARRVVRRPDFAVAPSIGGIDPVIQPPFQSVDPKLGIALAEPGQHDAPLVSAAIAVLIAQEPDIGRGRHEHAAEAGHHAIRETAARRRRQSNAHSGRRRRGPPAAGSAPRSVATG